MKKVIFKQNIKKLIIITFCFFFIVILLFFLQNIKNHRKSAQSVFPQVQGESAEKKLEFSPYFGFNKMLAKSRKDPVLGETFNWSGAKGTLQISDKGIYYRNANVLKGKNPNSDKAEKAARKFLEERKLKLNNLVLNKKLNYYQFAENELKQIYVGNQADLIELTFIDQTTQNEAVSMFVTGADDVWKMYYRF